MNITDIIIIFRETQDISILGVTNNSSNLEDYNVIAIEILAWLKLEYKRLLWQAEGKKTKLKPLRLNMQYSWCMLLSELMDSKTVFADVFEITDNNLEFKASVSDEYRLSARKSAFENYNPEKII